MFEGSAAGLGAGGVCACVAGVRARPAATRVMAKNAIERCMADILSGDKCLTTSVPALDREFDDHIRRFRLVRLEADAAGISPVGEIDHHAQVPVALFGLDRLHDVEAVTVEKVGMVPEQALQLRHRRMFCRYRLGVELVERLLDLSGVHLHRTLLPIGGLVMHRCIAGPTTRGGERLRSAPFLVPGWGGSPVHRTAGPEWFANGTAGDRRR